MKKLMLIAAAAASAALHAETPPLEKELDRQAEAEIVKTVKTVGKLDFQGDGVILLFDEKGKKLGTARRTFPADSAAEGFRGPVPVVVLFAPDGRIRTVLPLKNREDRGFWNRLLKGGIFDSWSGFTAAEAAEIEVDAVTGATYSSRGVIESTRRVLRRQNGKK